MKRAKDYALRHKHRPGYHQVKDKYGNVLDEIPLDFPDPATWDIDEYWLEYAAFMWKASGTPLPPTLSELQWRDRKWDEEVAGYRMMLDFYIKMDKRPTEFQGVYKGDDLTQTLIANGAKDERA